MTEKTNYRYGNDVWARQQRLRLPSRLNTATRNAQRLLRLPPETRFLEPRKP